jgi:hypothetical protein
MTFEEIGDLVRDLMDDGETDVRAMIDVEINNTYMGLINPVGETEPPWWLTSDATLTLADGTQVYDDTAGGAGFLAQNISRILTMSVDGSPVGLIKDVKEIELYAGKGYHDTAIKDKPHSVYHGKTFNGDGTEINKVIFYLTPDSAYTVSYWYEIRVSRLSATTDVPLLPDFAHSAIAYGTLTKMALFDLAVKAGPWKAYYDTAVAQLTTYRKIKHFQS